MGCPLCCLHSHHQGQPEWRTESTRSELGHGGGWGWFGRARREKVINQQQELKYSAATKYFTEAVKAARDTGHRVTAEARPDHHGRSAHGKNHTPHKQNTSWCGCCAASSQWRERGFQPVNPTEPPGCRGRYRVLRARQEDLAAEYFLSPSAIEK